MLNFDLQREGFDVKIGNHTFFVETNGIALSRLLKKEQVFLNTVDTLKKELDQVDLDNITVETAETVENLTRELAKAQYDYLLGDGTFDIIFSDFPYADILIENYPTIEEAVTKEMNKAVNDREKKLEKEKEKILKKKRDKK